MFSCLPSLHYFHWSVTSVQRLLSRRPAPYQQAASVKTEDTAEETAEDTAEETAEDTAEETAEDTAEETAEETAYHGGQKSAYASLLQIQEKCRLFWGNSDSVRLDGFHPFSTSNMHIGPDNPSRKLEGGGGGGGSILGQAAPLTPFLNGRMFVRRIYFGQFDEL